MAGTQFDYTIREMPPLIVNVKIGHRVRMRLWVARLLVELAAWVLQAKETNIEEEDLT